MHCHLHQLLISAWVILQNIYLQHFDIIWWYLEKWSREVIGRKESTNQILLSLIMHKYAQILSASKPNLCYPTMEELGGI